MPEPPPGADEHVEILGASAKHGDANEVISTALEQALQDGLSCTLEQAHEGIRNLHPSVVAEAHGISLADAEKFVEAFARQIQLKAAAAANATAGGSSSRAT